MLRLIKEKFWVVYPDDLLKVGIRHPQGFSLNWDLTDRRRIYYWTTNEDVAFYFYKKHQLATPEVVKSFETREKESEYLYNLSHSVNSDIELVTPKHLEYRSYQKSGIEYLLKTKNTLVADAMRLGKTIVTLGYLNNIEFNKVIILCPKTVKPIWFMEAKKWLIKDCKIQVVDAQSKITDANIYILNYDILHLHPELVKQRYDVIIGDEVHLVKNLDARRSKYFFSINAEKKIGLSGTPLLNKPDDLLTVLQWLDPYWKIFRTYKGKFTSQTGVTLNLEDVQDIIRSSVMLRRVQSQVFDGEPIERRTITLTVDDDVRPLVKAELNGITDYVKIRQQLGISKVRHALRHIDAYSNGDKMVVFAAHREVVDRIASSLGNKVVVVNGETSENGRKLAIERFNTDPNCTVFLGSIRAASMGINLSAASHILFIEFDWTPGLMEQAESRCSDKNQNNQVLVEYMVYEGSLDSYMLSKISEKDHTSVAATDIIV